MIFALERHFTGREGWKRIYLDLPGRGKTAGADWIVSNDQVLDILEQFIDRLVPGERFLVAGQSYGGYLARGVVYRRGAEIDGVLLSVPAMSSSEDLPPRTEVVRDPAIMALARAENLAGFEDIVVTQIRFIQIVAAAAIPVTQVLWVGFSARLSAALLGAFIVLMQGLQGMWHDSDHYSLYRATAEELIRHRFLFSVGAGPYANPPPGKTARLLLAENVDAIVSRENQQWLNAQAQGDAGHDAPAGGA
jgi:pimeloyl-ACP methyl ester carboxylesterase